MPAGDEGRREGRAARPYAHHLRLRREAHPPRGERRHPEAYQAQRHLHARTDARGRVHPAHGQGAAGMSQFHAFKGILHRDLLVFWRNLRGNSVRIFVQPAFFLVVFGVLMPKLGLFAKGYAGVLIPGVVTISAMTAASFGVGALVWLRFFRNPAIRAHLLAPLSLELFVLENIVSGVSRALVSSVSMLLVGGRRFRNISGRNPLGCLVI